MRIIDADAIEWSEQLVLYGNGKYEYMRIAYMDDIDDLPTVKPERKKGKWLANDDIPTECPFCGEDWDKYVFGEVWYTGELPKFCPNCGEDMREGE